MEHEAIYNLYPLVKHIIEDDNGNFIAKDKNENVIDIDMSAVETKAVELQTAYNNEQETLKTNKVSAYKKLDMTDDEILSIDPSLEEYL